MSKQPRKTKPATKKTGSRTRKELVRKTQTIQRETLNNQAIASAGGESRMDRAVEQPRPNRFLDTQNLVPVRRRPFRDHFRSLAAASPFDLAGAEPAAEIQVFPRPDELAPRDWAVYLLRRAAQIEHALMVQYLFAAYSVREQLPLGGGATTDDWYENLLQIAKEEMGHLLIVQNLLRLIGGPLCFDREEFPVASDLYPFPFQLERVTKDSLAKYVFTEMSAKPLPETVISAAKRQEIEERARQAAGVASGAFINHVGTLYDTLLDVFENELREGPNGDFRTDRHDYLAGKSQFSRTNDKTTDLDGTPNLTGIKALAPTNQSDAVTALRIVGQQGEAADEPLDTEESHFERFLLIYEQCPEDTAGLTWPVVANPNTHVTAPDAGTIPLGKSRLWAKLFNVRYRILLMSLSHALAVPAVSQGAPTPRKELIRWVYQEMTDSQSALRDLAKHIVTLPMTDGSDHHAGPPFELPYSLALPDQAPERWRMHSDLVNASQAVIQLLRTSGASDPLLDDLDVRDANRRTAIAALENSGF